MSVPHPEIPVHVPCAPLPIARDYIDRLAVLVTGSDLICRNSERILKNNFRTSSWRNVASNFKKLVARPVQIHQQLFHRIRANNKIFFPILFAQRGRTKDRILQGERIHFRFHRDLTCQRDRSHCLLMDSTHLL